MTNFTNKPITRIRSCLDDYGGYIIVYRYSEINFIRIHQDYKNKTPYLWCGVPVLLTIKEVTLFANALEYVKMEMQKALKDPEYIEELYNKYKDE